MQLSTVTGIRPSKRTFQPSNELVDPLCVVGVEIEAENLIVFPYDDVDEEYWSVVDDGSLRNHGREMVSKPLFGEDLVSALESAENILNNTSAQLSNRCGLHIHIDVSGFDVEDLISLSCIVAMAEPFLFKYVGGDREDNIYCLPMSSTEGIVKYYNAIKYGRHRHDVSQSINSLYKYSAFNILPIMRQGSVEFRHHPGTWDKDVILKWINILQQLRMVAQQYTGSQLTSMPYHEIMPTIFGQFVDELCPSGEPDINGWLLAKDILNLGQLDELFTTTVGIYQDASYLVPRTL